MKPVPINTARTIGKKAGADRLIIIAVSEEGEMTWTTWGENKQKCDILGKWARLFADNIAQHLDDWTLEGGEFAEMLSAEPD